MRSSRYPGPFEGILLALGAGAVGVALFNSTHGRWADVAAALVFALAFFAAGAWSHRLGTRRRF